MPVEKMCKFRLADIEKAPAIYEDAKDYFFAFMKKYKNERT